MGIQRKAAATTTLIRLIDTTQYSSTSYLRTTLIDKNKSSSTKAMSLIHYMFDESPSLFPRSAAAEQLMMMPVFMNDSCATKKRKPLCSLGNSHLDVIERDTKYEIFIDTPGLGPSDVKVAIEDGILSIEGKRGEKTRKMLRMGKSYIRK